MRDHMVPQVRLHERARARPHEALLIELERHRHRPVRLVVVSPVVLQLERAVGHWAHVAHRVESAPPHLARRPVRARHEARADRRVAYRWLAARRRLAREVVRVLGGGLHRRRSRDHALHKRSLRLWRQPEHALAVERAHTRRPDDDRHVDRVSHEHEPGLEAGDDAVADAVHELRECDRIEEQVAQQRPPLQVQRRVACHCARAGDERERDHPRADDRADAEVGVLARLALAVDGFDCPHRVDDDLGRRAPKRHEGCARDVLTHVEPYAECLERRDEVAVGYAAEA
mmetsp:Transcript_8241/g.26074  ORF Transcript_8241/g.26074 Transcript_8241/m.26074 type:complete len:287 (+) Transcript_8241:740-1600(+)